MAVSINPVVAGGAARAPRIFSADATISAGTTSLSEQILKQVTIPAGVLRSCTYFSVQVLFAKSGTTDAASSCRLRIGTAGTVADTAVANTAIFLAANRSCTIETFLATSSATGLRLVTTSGVAGFSGAVSAAAVPATATVPDMDTNNLILSVCMTMAGTTDTPSVANVLVTLF